MKMMSLTALAVVCVAGSAMGGLVETKYSGTGTNPATGVAYTGAGTGFGGTLGNGSIRMNTDGTSIGIGMTYGGTLDNIVVVLIDSKAGGQTDATMDDQADGGRRAISNLAAAVNDSFDPNFLPDYGIAIGSFGSVLFELTAGNTPGHLNFLQYSPSTTGDVYSLATLGTSAANGFNFLVAYISDSGYASNESIPAYGPLQSNGNPGFGDGQFGGTIGTPGYGNYNRFAPTPGAASLLGLAGLAGLRRRRA